MWRNESVHERAGGPTTHRHPHATAALELLALIVATTLLVTVTLALVLGAALRLVS